MSTTPPSDLSHLGRVISPQKVRVSFKWLSKKTAQLQAPPHHGLGCVPPTKAPSQEHGTPPKKESKAHQHVPRLLEHGYLFWLTPAIFLASSAKRCPSLPSPRLRPRPGVGHAALATKLSPPLQISSPGKWKGPKPAVPWWAQF